MEKTVLVELTSKQIKLAEGIILFALFASLLAVDYAGKSGFVLPDTLNRMTKVFLDRLQAIRAGYTVAQIRNELRPFRRVGWPR